MQPNTPVDATESAELIQAWLQEIRKVVVGQDAVVTQALVSLLAGGHLLIEGLPGLGKTLLARSMAQVIGGVFSRVQFTPDLMPADIAGHAMFDRSTEQFRIRKGPVFCNVLLGDEINRAPAKTQAALLEAMQEGQVTIEGKTFSLPAPFLVMATQNPIEHEGTYPLPQAQLDRFLLNVTIDYPSADEEVALVERVTDHRVGDHLDLTQVQQVLDLERLQQLQLAAAQVQVEPNIVDYVVRLVRSTREWQGLEFGAGPRASIALLRAARAQALCSGQDFVTPHEVKQMAVPVLRHRVQLEAALEIEGRRVEEVLLALLEIVEAPRH